MDRAHEILKDTFKHQSFKLTQEKVIERLLKNSGNRNSLVLWPTGGGKSLCYQVPGLCLPYLTLVISPLIALMKDQVDALIEAKVPAARLDSSLTTTEAADVKEGIRTGQVKILYVAPERLRNENFMKLIKPFQISLLAIDEAHCISEWGSSFRPDYLKIARFAKDFQVERTLCLTATSTKKATEDICRSFDIPEEGVFQEPAYRPNLSFEVKTAVNLDDKLEQLLPLLQSRTGSVIIYVTLQKQAERVKLDLGRAGIDAQYYHAGLDSEQRKRIQDRFMKSENSVVVATIAFGMGINKSNIRMVVHMYLPKTLENYAQEVGRAGRDGKPSTCLMYLSAPDIPVLEGFCRGDTISKSSLQGWLKEVIEKERDHDGCLSFKQSEQQNTYDIRVNVLDLLYAALELDRGLIRTTTPYYCEYEIVARSADAEQRLENDRTQDGSTVFRFLKKRPIAAGYIINVIERATPEFDRERIANQIVKWEGEMLIDVKGKQVRERYEVTGDFPTTAEEKRDLVNRIYENMRAREEYGVTRLYSVIEFATGDKCLAHALATYFGDEDAVPNGECGHCSYCKNKGPVAFDPVYHTVAEDSRIQAVLKKCFIRDDPRALARFAFGIPSPRLRRSPEYYNRAATYGSMDDVAWNALLDAFTKVCDEHKATPGGSQQSPRSSPKKRSWGGGSSSGSPSKRVRR